MCAGGDFCSDIGSALLPFNRILEAGLDVGRAAREEEAVEIVLSLAGAGSIEPVVCVKIVNNL